MIRFRCEINRDGLHAPGWIVSVEVEGQRHHFESVRALGVFLTDQGIDGAGQVRIRRQVADTMEAYSFLMALTGEGFEQRLEQELKAARLGLASLRNRQPGLFTQRYKLH